MKFIAHRGNINGPKKELENKPLYIEEAIKNDFDVEVDVRIHNGLWYLGHDTPDYQINLEFLKNEKLWCHAKNIEAFYHMLMNNVHCFWHENDQHTLTSKGYIWAYPGSELTDMSICVMPEISQQKNRNVFGFCSDFVERIKNESNSNYNVYSLKL